MDLTSIDHSNLQLKALLKEFPSEGIPLDLGACAIARPHRPGLNNNQVLDQLEQLSKESIATAINPDDPISILDAIRETLFHRHGFHGNIERYYLPENSFIDRVLETKRGIPITLSLVMMEVARRAGVVIEGFALPCHFLVGYRKKKKLTLYDPFSAGEEKTYRECVDMVQMISGGTVTLGKHHFVQATPREILVRMLMNLRGIYRNRNEPLHLIAVLKQLLLIDPHEGSVHGELAMSLANTGSLIEAHHHLKVYSEWVSGTLGTKETDWVRQVRSSFSTYN